MRLAALLIEYSTHNDLAYNINVQPKLLEYYRYCCLAAYYITKHSTTDRRSLHPTNLYFARTLVEDWSLGETKALLYHKGEQSIFFRCMFFRCVYNVHQS